MDVFIEILTIAGGFFVGFLALDGFKAFVRYVKRSISAKRSERVRHAYIERTHQRRIMLDDEIENMGSARL